MRKKFDEHEKIDDTFKRDISLDLQNIHLTIEKKFDMLIESQNIKNECFEKNDQKLARAIESMNKKLPHDEIDWAALGEMVQHYKDNKDFEKKIKLTLKEKFAFGIIMLASNAGLLFIVIPVLKLINIDITKIPLFK
jgi:hypothetical protein